MVENKQLSLVKTLLLLLSLMTIAALLHLFSGKSFSVLIKLYNSVPLSEIESIILFNIRLPRLVTAIAAGGSLALCGLTMQGLTANPLVEPFTLGIAGGASLGVAIAYIFNLSIFLTPLCGFIGALVILFIIFLLSIKRKGFVIREVLLTGIILSFICSSLVTLIITLSPEKNLQEILFWTMGSLEGNGLHQALIFLAISIIMLFFIYFYANELNALVHGKDEAASLGIDSDKIQIKLFIVSAFLTALCVSQTGMIGFVGIMVPHILSLIIKKDMRVLLPAAFLTGASFLTISDILSRSLIAPREIPIGVITGFSGGIIFLYLLLREGKE